MYDHWSVLFLPLATIDINSLQVYHGICVPSSTTFIPGDVLFNQFLQVTRTKKCAHIAQRDVTSTFDNGAKCQKRIHVHFCACRTRGKDER